MNIITTQRQRFSKNTVVNAENADVYRKSLKGTTMQKLLEDDSISGYLIRAINDTKYFTVNNADQYFRTVLIGKAPCLVFVIPDEYVAQETHTLVGSPYRYNSVEYGDLHFSIRNDYMTSKYGLTFCLFGMRNPRRHDISDSYEDFLMLTNGAKAIMLDACKEELVKNIA